MNSKHTLHCRTRGAGWLGTMLLLLSTEAPALCFTPLASRSSHNPADWKDLTDFNPTDSAHPVTKADGVKNFLPIKDGFRDKINLDYYEMTFNVPPDKPILTKFFRDLRGSFPEFAKDQSQDFDFHPYRVSTDEMDVVAKRYQTIWNQAVPTGALMSFQLHVVTFVKSVGISPRFVNGDVQATCATDTDFVFSTVETKEDGKHPVSGNRGFGLRDNKDGSWTFYSMGADRETDYFPNRFYVTKAMDGMDTFQEGAAFWHSFYGQLTKTLAARGAAPRALFENSCRYKFDANQGANGSASGNPLECTSATPP